MEAAQSKKQQKKNKRKSTSAEVQQRTQLQDMEDTSKKDEPSSVLTLDDLEEQIRIQLDDSGAKLTQSASGGRVSLELQKESLIYFLIQLQENKKSIHEREKMDSEMCSLRAQLDQAQVSVCHPQDNSKELRSEFIKLAEALWTTGTELQQQIEKGKNLQDNLEKMREDKAQLHKQVEAMKVQADTAEVEARTRTAQLECELASEKAQVEELREELSKLQEALLKEREEAKEAVARCETWHQALLEEQKAETSKITAALKKAESLLETERLSWEQEKTTLLEELDKSSVSHAAQLEEKRRENNILMTAMRTIQKQVEMHRIKWQEDRSSLLDATDSLPKTLKTVQQDVMEAVVRSEASHRDQLEQHKAESNRLASALRTAQDLLESERLRWQQETMSLLEEKQKSTSLHVAQLEEKMNENATLAQATEALKRTLQEKEQEWDEKESSMIAQLEDLESQMKKKKKKKWYRKLFQRTDPHSGAETHPKMCI